MGGGIEGELFNFLCIFLCSVRRCKLKIDRYFTKFYIKYLQQEGKTVKV